MASQQSQQEQASVILLLGCSVTSSFCPGCRSSCTNRTMSELMVAVDDMTLTADVGEKCVCVGLCAALCWLVQGVTE